MAKTKPTSASRPAVAPPASESRSGRKAHPPVARSTAHLPSPSTGSPRRRRWITGLVAGGALLALLTGAFLLRPALLSHRAAAPAPAAPLPDAPTPEEQALLAALTPAPIQNPKSKIQNPAVRLGDYYHDQARPFAALWAYAFALPTPSQNPQSKIHNPAAVLGLARALEGALFPEAAITRLRGLLALTPGQPEAVAHLAELYLRTGRPAAALAVVNGADASYRASVAGGVLEGRVREALGDVKEAEAAYRRAVGQDGPEAEDAPAWHRLGLLALAQDRPDDARQALQQARSLDPVEPRYAVDLGRAVAAGGSAKDRQVAMDLYRAAVSARPYAPAYYHGGLLLDRQGNREAAMESFVRATKADRDFAEAYRELARLTQAAGRRAEAHYQRGLYYSVKDLRTRSLREYLAMAAADRGRPNGLMMASQSEFKMFHTARAATLARQLFARYPDNNEVREQLIAILITVADRKGAAQRCQEWLKAEPDAVTPIYLLGSIAVDDLRFAEGIRYYEQALSRDPDNPVFLESLGEALLSAPGDQQLPRAVQVLSRAVDLAPRHAKARYQFGLALMRSGRLAEAQRHLLRSLDLDPNRGATYGTIVQLAHRLRQPGAVALFAPLVREVEARLREELSLWRHTWDQPDDPAGYLALARFLIRTTDLRKAESQLEQALTLRPHWPEAEKERARVHRLLAVLEERK